MNNATQLGPGIYQVAGPDLTDPRDAQAYLVEDGNELAMIDAGAGPSYHRIIDQIRLVGQDPVRLRMIIATHAHIDHVGALADFARDYGVSIVAHEEDSQALETADPAFTAARSYGMKLNPVEVTLKLKGRINRLALGQTELVCLHTPGHTPGSMVVYLDRDGKRYLFGQDIHGPFSPAFGSDLNAWR
ncbi:MAG: MBL fold metallo-hydrolase, partial [Deltaproteobacteria bacterium]|nr:MBL fold metallo-hydrolase [Deltaproteobacteria bacterium]